MPNVRLRKRETFLARITFWIISETIYGGGYKEQAEKMFSNWLTQSTSSASAPSTSTTTTAPQPDIIIEVGPPPYARYAAHCALLSAHSGYLRSAIRPDEQQLHHHHHHHHRHHTNDTIYLPNITAEQFSPLLTYMYTGFLDLSIENIFAVLLATHVLHMPRAADICRTFLARTQSDGYLGGAFLAAAATASTSAPQPPPPPSEKGTVKIIRPIASKATPLMTARFVAPPPSSSLAISLPSRETTFKSLHLPTLQTRNDDDDDEEVVVVVEEETPTMTTVKQAMNNQDEDEERIVDVVVDEDDEPPPKIGGQKRKESKRGSGGGGRSKKTRLICEIVESPIKLDEINGGHSKTIIDIASCDGPVRFRRVLNDAYGRCAAATATTPTATAKSMINVANSFHLQMAKTISEQRCLQQSAEESENSQEINVGGSINSPQPAAEQLAKVRPIDEQVYSCVYCKHTFKSQYCYQKHAKRHINPLTLEVITGGGGGGCEASTDLLAETIDSSGSDDKDDKSVTAAKREVRPLDMNVQYYPCKTCGSKFPSYYFVHKHRKLCHADVGDVVVLNGEDNVGA